MRLIHFGNPGSERPGLQTPTGIVDLRAHFPSVPDIDEDFFRQGWVEKLAGIELSAEPLEVRLGSPVKKPSKIICLGKNYIEHAKEGGFEAPQAPLLFCKATTALNGPYDPIHLPASSDQVDWEVELALVIGREGKRIGREAAFDFVAGYTIMNDVSARGAQFSDGQWFRGKSFDGFAPLGPALVTPEEVGPVGDLRLTASVDGQVMQDGTTADLIFDIPHLLEYISRDITLVPGDIISTGTPAGVGIFRTPPVVLTAGNVVECRIENIGSLINRIEPPAD